MIPSSTINELDDGPKSASPGSVQAVSNVSGSVPTDDGVGNASRAEDGIGKIADTGGDTPGVGPLDNRRGYVPRCR